MAAVLGFPWPEPEEDPLRGRYGSYGSDLRKHNWETSTKLQIREWVVQQRNVHDESVEFYRYFISICREFRDECKGADSPCQTRKG